MSNTESGPPLSWDPWVGDRGETSSPQTLALPGWCLGSESRVLGREVKWHRPQGSGFLGMKRYGSGTGVRQLRKHPGKPRGKWGHLGRPEGP